MDAKDTLRRHNIRPSLNRLMVLEYLVSNMGHLTAYEIYTNVKLNNSILSKMTVYNVLKVLKDADIITEVKIDSKEVRYELKSKSHGHFKCNKCNKIIDFAVDFNSINTQKLNEYKIDGKDLFFYGMCAECLKK